MFTGIVEEVGTVAEITGPPGPQLTVTCNTVLGDTKIGDSINVNGCCLTVVKMGDGSFTADMMGETLARTALGELAPGAHVNLERALQLSGRLGGHLVQGHVDGVGEIVEMTPQQSEHGDRWTVMRCAMPSAVARYVVEKGSITVVGVSLTVTDADGVTFGVGLIPHTMAVTVLGGRAVGDRVNLETDVIAKYTEQFTTRAQ